jgi:hypothetical protein
MTRHSFVKFLGPGMASLSLPGFRNLNFKKEVPRKPDILFIMSDDHAANAFSCYGILKRENCGTYSFSSSGPFMPN